MRESIQKDNPKFSEVERLLRKARPWSLEIDPGGHFASAGSMDIEQQKRARGMLPGSLEHRLESQVRVELPLGEINRKSWLARFLCEHVL
jgi:hypothetical protein